MRVLFCALLLVGAMVVVWHLRPGATPASTQPASGGGEATPNTRRAELAPRASTPPITTSAWRPPMYRGVVIDGKSGEPVEDAQVMLCRAIKDGHPACADSVASADTDEQGRFEIERPDEDVTALVVDVDGFAPAIVQTPGAVSRVELWPPAMVSGFVVNKSGETVDGVRVGWMLPSAQLRLDPDETSERGGVFAIGGLPSGEVMLYAITDDHRTTIAKLVLDRGEHRRNVELVMDDAEPLHVRGVVQDRMGRPLAFTAVTIEARNDLSAPDADALLAADQQRHLKTDVDGEFELDFHTPGPHRLSFWAWDRETGDLLAEALVTASADPAQIKIPVWDPYVVICRLQDDRGDPQNFTEYWYSYSLVNEEEEGGSIGAGGGAMGSKGHAELAFVWPRRITSIEISLEGQSAEGSVTLRGPNDPCVARGNR